MSNISGFQAACRRTSKSIPPAMRCRTVSCLIAMFSDHILFAHPDGFQECLIGIEQPEVRLHDQHPVPQTDEKAVHDAFNQIDLAFGELVLFPKPQDIAKYSRYCRFEDTHSGR